MPAGRAQPSLSSPGGDTAELIVATMIYYNLTGTTPTQKGVESIVHKYIDLVASPFRKFYLHTGERAFGF